jgi:tetratricopeptide (TPR) repeat protein
MSGRRRSSGLCSLLCFLLLACVAASLAETNNPSSSDTSKSICLPAVSAELKGDTLMARGQFSAALREYLRETNQSAVLLNKIGLAYHHLLAFDQALRYYQQALAYCSAQSRISVLIQFCGRPKSRFEIRNLSQPRSGKEESKTPYPSLV